MSLYSISPTPIFTSSALLLLVGAVSPGNPYFAVDVLRQQVRKLKFSLAMCSVNAGTTRSMDS